jgi:hypothetical protein
MKKTTVRDSVAMLLMITTSLKNSYIAPISEKAVGHVPNECFQVWIGNLSYNPTDFDRTLGHLSQNLGSGASNTYKYFSVKMSGALCAILQKICGFGNTTVLNTTGFIIAEHIKLFKTIVFIKLKYLLNYFEKKTLHLNAPLTSTLRRLFTVFRNNFCLSGSFEKFEASKRTLAKWLVDLNSNINNPARRLFKIFKIILDSYERFVFLANVNSLNG